ncbi:hypothetical protein ACHWQZ_G000507 [Mnemiopsis leidyi]
MRACGGRRRWSENRREKGGVERKREYGGGGLRIYVKRMGKDEEGRGVGVEKVKGLEGMVEGEGPSDQGQKLQSDKPRCPAHCEMLGSL